MEQKYGQHKKERNKGNKDYTKKAFQTTCDYKSKEILMETEIWPVGNRIQNATLILYHNIKNSDGNRK